MSTQAEMVAQQQSAKSLTQEEAMKQQAAMTRAQGRGGPGVPATLQHDVVTGLPLPQLAVLKRSVLDQSFTDDEVRLYVLFCQGKRIDPFAGQIFAVKRKQRVNGQDVMKVVMQSGIDCYRAMAAGTGEYAGSAKPLFSHNAEGQLIAAEVTVYRFVQGQKVAFEAEVYWAEFCPPKGQDHMWVKMPYHMLAKCAEAQALRKAFPSELAGTHEEAEVSSMQHVTVDAERLSPASALNSLAAAPAQEEAPQAAQEVAKA